MQPPAKVNQLETIRNQTKKGKNAEWGDDNEGVIHFVSDDVAWKVSFLRKSVCRDPSTLNDKKHHGLNKTTAVQSSGKNY